MRQQLVALFSSSYNPNAFALKLKPRAIWFVACPSEHYERYKRLSTQSFTKQAAIHEQSTRWSCRWASIKPNRATSQRRASHLLYAQWLPPYGRFDRTSQSATQPNWIHAINVKNKLSNNKCASVLLRLFTSIHLIRIEWNGIKWNARCARQRQANGTGACEKRRVWDILMHCVLKSNLAFCSSIKHLDFFVDLVIYCRRPIEWCLNKGIGCFANEFYASYLGLMRCPATP